MPILLCMMTSIYKAGQAKLELEIYSIEGNYYLPALELLFLRRRSSSQHKWWRYRIDTKWGVWFGWCMWAPHDDNLQFEVPSSVFSFQSKVMSEVSISLISEELVCWEKGKSPDSISIMKFSFWNFDHSVILGNGFCCLQVPSSLAKLLLFLFSSTFFTSYGNNYRIQYSITWWSD